MDLSPAQVFHILLDEGTLPGERLDLLPAAARQRRGPRTTTPGDASAAGAARARGPHAAGRVELGHHEAEAAPAAASTTTSTSCWTSSAATSSPGVSAPCESGELAKELIADAVARHRVPPGQLRVHADNGSSMTSNPVVELLTFLGIGRSHSRPHVSNDNPYCESQFKTLKYCPAFPDRFGCIEDAHAFCEIVLHLLQPRAPPLRHRLPHARVGPLRHRHRGARPTTGHPRRCLRRQPRAVPAPPTRTPETPDRRLDQRTRTRRSRRTRDENVSQNA